jgi:hypothetical protein
MSNMRRVALLVLVLIIAQITTTSVLLADTAADEAAIHDLIADLWQDVAAKKIAPSGVSPEGCAIATSQGGFWQYLSPDEFTALINDAPNTLDFKPAYIQIQFLGSQKDVAYVSYYLSGTIRLAGEGGIADYRTRASNVMEKIDGRWVMAGSHYSPLFGGSGVRFQ